MITQSSNLIHGLILDPTHRVLVTNSLKIPSDTGGSLQGFTEKMKSLGIEIDAPVGVAPPEYVFLIPSAIPAPSGYRWITLMEAAKVLTDGRYWKLYTSLMLGGYCPPTKSVDVFSFGNSPRMAARLAHLVVKGKKRSTSGNPIVLRKVGITIPTPGLISMITDGFGIPLCCIETERVDSAKFSEVPEAVAIGEGEGDMSLGDWRKTHWDYFSKEAKALEIPFDESSEIITEWFRVLKVFGDV